MIILLYTPHQCMSVIVLRIIRTHFSHKCFERTSSCFHYIFLCAGKMIIDDAVRTPESLYTSTCMKCVVKKIFLWSSCIIFTLNIFVVLYHLPSWISSFLKFFCIFYHEVKEYERVER